jgi:hypothetical protein
MKTHNIDTLFLFITKDDLIVGSEPTQNMNKKEAKKMRVEISAALEFNSSFLMFSLLILARSEIRRSLSASFIYRR